MVVADSDGETPPPASDSDDSDEGPPPPLRAERDERTPRVRTTGHERGGVSAYHEYLGAAGTQDEPMTIDGDSD